MACVLLSLIIVVAFFLHFDVWNKIVEWAQPYSKEWVQPIIVSAIGGLLVYCYVMWIERRKEKRAIKREQKRDENEKRKEYTTALLSTQMTIILQMRAMYSLKEFIRQRLDVSLNGKKFRTHLENVKNISEGVHVLWPIMKQDEDAFTQKVGVLIDPPIIEPLVDNKISFPSGIFGIQSIAFSEKGKVELVIERQLSLPVNDN